MKWQNEKDIIVDEEKSLKAHVEGELKSYYLYLHKWNLLEREKKSLRCSTGGSVIRMPDGVSDGKSPQERLSLRMQELKDLQIPYEEKMERIEKWISVLPEKYYVVVVEYMMKNLGKKAKEIGWKLEIGEDLVKKRAERACLLVCSRNSNIL